MTEQEFIQLEGNIRKVWDGYFKNKQDLINPLYNMINDTTAQITDLTMGAPGRMSDWTGSVEYDTLNIGYSHQVRPDKKSTGIQIDRDMWEDKEYRSMKTYVNSVAWGVEKTLRYDSAVIWNNAFGTTYKGPDSAGLCSASHHITYGDDAQTNTGTLELTYENVETTQNAMEQWVDDRGDEMLVEGNMIVAGPYWRKTCKQLFGDRKEAYTGDNTINAYEGMDYFIHPLIKGKKWFMTNSDLMKNGAGLNFWMRRDPRTLERDGSAAMGDFNTEKLSWKSVGRWKIYWMNWFFVYGHNPG
ncbi:MAG: hypothetical protein ACFFDF_00400 [Candidatus Odinarchaeota archaeon]